MSKVLRLVVCIFFYACGCTQGVARPETLKNDKIDRALRDEIDVMSKHAYKSLGDNSYGMLSQLFSDSMLMGVTPDFAQKFMPQIQRVIKGRPYKSFDEFYIKAAKKGDSIRMSGGKGDNAYTLNYIAGEGETYISMMVAGDSVNEVMLTLIYVKLDGKWKLNALRGEDYSLGTKDAAGHYQHAVKLYKEGSLIDALNVMSLGSHCVNPGGFMFRYTKEKEMSGFYDTLNAAAKAKYPLPYIVKEVSTKPSVVHVSVELVERQFVPMVYYQSSVTLTDTVSLKKENDEMQKNIGKIFSGIDRNNKMIVYRVYNQLPREGQNDPPYYGYMQRLK
ncbi:MAG: hypothetical protein K0Q79_2341 [Flavipsychrobacter sp.]|nr:hypothetical protein [Flavipsychrobacter sp.]